MAAELGAIEVRFGADIADLVQGTAQATQSIRGTVSEVQKLTQRLAAEAAAAQASSAATQANAGEHARLRLELGRTGSALSRLQRLYQSATTDESRNRVERLTAAYTQQQQALRTQQQALTASERAAGQFARATVVDAQRAETAFNNLPSSLRRVQSSLRDVSQGLTSAGQSLRNNVTVPLVAFGGGAVLAADQLDRLQLGLGQFSGSAQATQAQIARLQEIARAPGLGFAEAAQGAIRIEAIGLSAGTAERAIRLFANATALTGGTKEDLAEIVRQYTQILSLGKVTAENLNVIKERSPAAAAAIVRAFAGQDLTKIPVEEFTRRLLSALETLPKAAPSLLEPLKNEFEALGLAIAPVGKSIATTFEPILQSLGKVVKSLSDAFVALSPEAQRTLVIIGAAAAILGPALVAFGGLTAAVSAALPALGAAAVFVAGLSLPVVAAIAAVAAFAAGLVILRGKLRDLNEAGAQSGNTFGGVVTRALAAAANAVDTFADKVPILYRGLAQLIPLGPALAALFDSFRSLGEVAKGDFFNLKDVVKQPGTPANTTDDFATLPPAAARDVRTLADVVRDLRAELAALAASAGPLRLSEAEVATRRVQILTGALQEAVKIAPGSDAVGSLSAQLATAVSQAERLGGVYAELRAINTRFDQRQGGTQASNLLADIERRQERVNALRREYDRLIGEGRTEAAAAALEEVQAAERLARTIEAPLQAIRTFSDEMSRAFSDAAAGIERTNPFEAAVQDAVELNRVIQNVRVGYEEIDRIGARLLERGAPLGRTPQGRTVGGSVSERATSEIPENLTRISAGYKAAADAARDFADATASAISTAVVDSGFALVQALFDADAGLRSLGDAAKAFGQSMVSALRDVLVQLGQVLLKALVLKGILAVANVLVPGSGTALGGILGAGGRAAPAVSPGVVPVAGYAAERGGFALRQVGSDYNRGTREFTFTMRADTFVGGVADVQSFVLESGRGT